MNKYRFTARKCAFNGNPGYMIAQYRLYFALENLRLRNLSHIVIMSTGKPESRAAYSPTSEGY